MRECCGGIRKTARSISAPKILIPSEVMGEYEDPVKEEKMRRKSAPLPSRPPGGGLYPLSEEGTYGLPPIYKQPVIYQKRERKPKVYASYAVSSDCCVHGEKLENNERTRNLSGSLRRSSSSLSGAVFSTSRRSLSLASNSTFAPSYSMRSDRRSVSASPERPMSRLSFNSDTSGYDSILTYESTQFMDNPTSTPVLSRRNSKYRAKRHLDFPEAVYEEETEEKETVPYESGLNSTWDSMGILGLTSKLFSETKTNQENFLTQDFFRKTSIGTHVC